MCLKPRHGGTLGTVQLKRKKEHAMIWYRRTTQGGTKLARDPGETVMTIHIFINEE